MPHVSQTYTSAMWSTKNGHGLWFPESLQPAGHTISIGDVGYIMKDGGQFFRFFNAEHPNLEETAGLLSDDERNHLELLAEKPLKYPKDLIAWNPSAIQENLCSTQTSVNAVEFGVGAEGASVGYKGECNDSSGAFLLLGKGGQATQSVVADSKAFRSHMKKNLGLWFRYASEPSLRGIALGRSEIVLIRGWIKTYNWTIGAINSSSSTRQGALEFDFQPIVEGAQAHFKLTRSKQNTGYLSLRRVPSKATWTLRRQITYGQSSGPGTSNLQLQDPDISQGHSVFIKYYRMKRVLGLVPHLKAAAGYDQLPDDKDGDEPAPPVPASPAAEKGEKPYTDPSDPVEAVLDYILKHSKADAAIACDDDFNTLLLDQPWPQDLQRWLEDCRPVIEVDEENVGMLSLEETVRRCRIHWIKKIRHHAKNSSPLPPSGTQDPDDSLGKGYMTSIASNGTATTTEWPHLCLIDALPRVTSIITSASSFSDELVVAAYDDRFIRIWRPREGRLLQRWCGHGDTILSVAVTPIFPPRVASGSVDGAIIVWDLQGSKALAQLEGHDAAVSSLAYSHDGRRLASGAADGTVRLWDATTHSMMHTLRGHAGGVAHVAFAFAHDGLRLVSCAGAVGRLWDAQFGSLVASLEGHTAPISGLRVSSAGGAVVTVSEDGSCRVWDVDTEEVVAVDGGVGSLSSVTFSGDDSRVICGGAGGLTEIDREEGKVRRFADIRGAERSAVTSVAISPSGSYTATGSADGSVTLWDSASGSFVGELMGHEGPVESVVFSKDGEDIYSSSQDGSIRVWSVIDVIRLIG